MNDAKTLLFPTNFSAASIKAASFATDYAQKSKSTITLINIIESKETVPEEMKQYFDTHNPSPDQIIATTKLLLHNLAKKMTEIYSVEVTYKIFFGSLINTLMKAVVVTNSEMIVMGTNGFSNLTGLHPHSHTYKIADKAPIPVITISAKANFSEIKKILFPINDKLYTTKKLNEIQRIGKLYNAEVILFGISPNSGDKLDDVGFYMEDIQKKLQSEKIVTKIAMAINKNYAEEILDFSNKNNIDLICIISKYDHGLASLFKTTPDEKLVEESTIPVLSIPLEAENLPSEQVEVEYISPWSMKFDINRVFLPTIFSK